MFDHQSSTTHKPTWSKSLANSFGNELWWWIIGFLILVVYAIFSYSLTTPNLILLQADWYWQFQEWMWQTFFHDRVTLTYSYVAILAVLFGWYAAYYRWQRRRHRPDQSHKFNFNAKWLLGYILLLSPLFVSYNSLSHDVFNYIFNARMVVLYQANPHERTAIEFADFDDWTRFMHNTHTPSPYAYGWTALSTGPYWLGGDSFLKTWFLFRAMAVFSLVLLYFVLRWSYWQLKGQNLSSVDQVLIFCNPLVLIEVVSNMHNDLWMMAPALAAFGLIFSLSIKQRFWWQKLGLSALLLVVSVSIKYVTLALIPVWLVFVTWRLGQTWWIHLIQKRMPLPELMLKPILAKVDVWVRDLTPLLASVALFVPLFTAQSQRFLPWYLLWSLVWLPLVANTWWRRLLLAFSVSAMLRYVPWMWAGEYTAQVSSDQLWVVWGLPALYLLWSLLSSRTQFNMSTSNLRDMSTK